MKHKLFLIFFLILIISINYIGNKNKKKVKISFVKEINLLTKNFLTFKVKKKIGGNYSCLYIINSYEINYKEDLIKYAYKNKINLKSIDMNNALERNIAMNYLEKILIDLRLLSREKQNTLYLFCNSENSIMGLSVYKKNLIPNFIFQIQE